MEEDEPCAKRKKQLSGREIIEKLESNENDVKKAVAEMVEGKLVIATEIESMVESMFEEEECG